jgi:heme exporter protein C
MQFDSPSIGTAGRERVNRRGQDLVFRLVTFLAGAGILLSLYMVFLYAPTEQTMGEVQRIFYFHVSSAWVGMAAFLVVFVGSVAYLRTQQASWDRLALSSAEIGTVFISMALITGSLWAKPTWNTWWTWDPRLTTSAVLWTIYVVYLILRGAIEEPIQRGRLAAVFGIVGFVDVPIVFMAVRWWRTIHPVIFHSEGFDLSGRMLATFVVSLVSFTLLFVSLLLQRYRLETQRSQLKEVKQLLEEQEMFG